jgi:dihydroxycyclohexadiene carboxylate dehydrogenase
MKGHRTHARFVDEIHRQVREVAMTTYPSRFAGKTAAVTGAAQGIGGDVPLRLAREGARVALVDRSDLVEEVRQEAPPRRVPRNTAPPSEQEKVRYQQIVDQALFRSRMKRFETTDEPAAAILFLASDEASYITGVTLPVAGGDLG